MAKSKLLLTKEHHERIQAAIKLNEDEDYSVVTHKRHGEWLRSIHVFSRLPTTKELTDFENVSSKVKFRGAGKAEVDSGAVQAANSLYNKLISRVYDLPHGPRRILGEIGKDGNSSAPVTAEQARELVPPLVKREALRDFIGEVYSESRIADREGEEESVEKEQEED
jgi:hypothetical protein